MSNPNNLTSTRGRLGHDVTIKKNADGSATVFLSVIVGRNFKTKGEYQSDSVNYQKYIPAGNAGQLDYYTKWGRKGFEVAVQGSIQSSKYEKDGETIYAQNLVIDSVDLSTNNAIKLKELSGDTESDPF